MKNTKTITTSSFSNLVRELAQAFAEGYTPVTEGVDAPYHQLLGNFVVVVEKAEKAVESPTVAGKAEPVPSAGVDKENAASEPTEAPKAAQKTGRKGGSKNV